MLRTALQLFLIVAPFIPATVWGIDAAEAYRFSGRRQTTYRPVQGDTASEQLSSIFIFTDQAAIAQVGMLRWYFTLGKEGDEFSVYKTRIEAVVSALRLLRVSEQVSPAKLLIVGALEDNKRFFSSWRARTGRGERFNLREEPDMSWIGRIRSWWSSPGPHPELVSSRGRLRQAYEILLREHPRETETNRQAILDHLRILDIL